MEVFVASTSTHKIAATKKACTDAFPSEDIRVEGRKAASNINEQPVGNEETLRGALNRLHNLKNMMKGTRYDLLVAMEGGMFPVQIGDEEKWFDCGWVVAEDTQGRQSVAHCAGGQFPDQDVSVAQNKGFDTTTVGSIIAERVGADGTDPQSYLTNGLLRRSEVLEQALLAAIGQLQMQSSEKIT